MEENDLSGNVIGAAIEVHRLLGPGLLESAYELALARELVLRGHRVTRQTPISLEYKGVALVDAFRIDLIVDESLLLEIKAVEVLLPIHERQLLTYLQLTGKRFGLVINFNEELLKKGVRRVINGY